MATLHHSGTETMLRAIGPAMAGQGWTSHILALSDTDAGPFAADLQAAGHIIHHIRFRRNLMLFRDLWDLFQRHRFDVIHIQCERGNLWLGLLGVLSGAHVVRTVNAVFGFRGPLRLRRLIQRRLSHWLGVVWVAPSHSVIANEQKTFFNPCAFLPNWIDDSRFPVYSPEQRAQARGALGYAEDVFLLASAGSCSPVKNHSALLQALSLLPETVHYLHAGDGPLGPEEEALATSLGVSHRVRRLGVVDHLAPYLAAADAFVMPSFHEGLGLAAVEALAVGTPCILSRVTGLSDLAPFNPAGRWCGTDPASIAEAIRQQQAQTTPALRDLALTMAVQVHAHFGVDQGLRSLISLYEHP